MALSRRTVYSYRREKLVNPSVMTWAWAIFAIFHLLSAGFAAFVISRLYQYIRRYRFEESQYTLLMGFIHLHWIVYLYAGFIALSIIISTILFLQ